MRLDPTQLTALVSSYIAGGISYETLFYNLKQGEILAPETTVEEEQDRIEVQAAQRSDNGDGFDAE